jgi:hypothetical protein
MMQNLIWIIFPTNVYAENTLDLCDKNCICNNYVKLSMYHCCCNCSCNHRDNSILLTRLVEVESNL